MTLLIPRVFHRFWFGGPMPAEFQRFGQTWVDLHPDWEMVTWNEAMVPQLRHQQLFDAATAISQKVDIASYEILLQRGGVYLDCDFECQKNIEPLLDGVELFAGKEDERLVAVGIFGAVPGHPALADVVAAIPESIAAHPGPWANEQTGPGLFTRVVEPRAETDSRIVFFEPELFYPYHHTERHRRGECFPDAYAVHHWAGSWLPAGHRDGVHASAKDPGAEDRVSGGAQLDASSPALVTSRSRLRDRVAWRLADSLSRGGRRRRSSRVPLTDISVLVSHHERHRRRLALARAAIGEGIRWYPHDTLGNIAHIDALLGPEYRDLGQLAHGQPVVDVGAADGDLAFALERQWGWQVDIVDSAQRNFNQLDGARALRERLGSNASVYDLDVDAPFRLPHGRYGIAFVLDVINHLKNPFLILEELSREAEHCIVSSRVARVAGDGTSITELPVAYLVSPGETNNDASKYWTFSPAGLERIIARSGWSVLARHNAGDIAASDPFSPDHDERMFMLLRSA